MSLNTVTVDYLMLLDKSNLEYALRIFQQELNGYLDLSAETPAARADEVFLADLANVLTLRKAITLRLEELVADEAFEAKMSHGSTALPQAA